MINLRRIIEKNKNKIITCIILWIILTIVLVSPFTYSNMIANAEGNFNLTTFFETFSSTISSPFSTLGKIFSANEVHNFFKNLIGFTLIYLIILFYGLYRSRPKHEYSDIEHGSSDWSKGGEQYTILNRNNGIILAENNYLPVDKRGNVNVLVVGRFWFR